MENIFKEVIKLINMKPILEIKTCVGIGDLILTYAQMEKVKEKYSEIRICPEYGILNTYRSGSQELHIFTKELASLLFDKLPYKLIDNSSCNLTSPDVLCSQGFTSSYIDLSDKLCLNDNSRLRACHSDYIVIQTKIRYLERDYFKSISEEFFKTITNIKYHKIVIMGERNMGACKESKIHNNIFTIYEPLKKALEGIEHWDLTKEVIIDAPDMNSFKKDLTIMKNAACVIMFGVSGMTTATIATAKTVANLRTDNMNIINDFCVVPDKNKKFITNNFIEFLEFIKRVTK